MTHQSSHVIISGKSLSQPVAFGETGQPTKVKFWHLLVALLLVGVVVGAVAI